MSKAAETFETWLLHRVAQAVEAREVSTALLTELQGAIAEARRRSPDEQHAEAIQELAEWVKIPVNRLTEILATLEAQLSVTRELLLRRVLEAWLKEQRAEYETRHQGGVNG